MTAPNLGEYVDYRKYLADFYEYKLKETRHQLRPYSYSDFSAAADIKSPSYLKLIIEGKRNLSGEMCKKFARALRLARVEVNEFELLVFYCQEKDTLQRNRLLKELSEFRAKRALASGQIDSQVWDHVASWLVWVLHAMTDQKNVKFEASELRKLFRGQVNENQILHALKKLQSSGEIIIDPETGLAKKAKALMSDADKVPAELVRKIQSELIYLGLESLHRDGPADREISGATLSLTEKEYDWVRHEVRKLRKSVQKEIQTNRESSKGDRVYQFNVQLFPITDSAGKVEEKSSEGPSII